jgi:FKBP-type peptidyl-prolyl cis-trans isomerase
MLLLLFSGQKNHRMGVRKEDLGSLGIGGRKAAKGDKVEVHVAGFLKDGSTRFWSTMEKKPKKPLKFTVGDGSVIKGLDIGVQGMQIGSTRRIHITADHAYGEKGFPDWNVPPNADIFLDVDMLYVK